MSSITDAMASWIDARVKAVVATLPGLAPEYRAVFNGPPAEMLAELFGELVGEEGGIHAVTEDGVALIVPVLLQVSSLPEGMSNPAVGASGICDAGYLLDLRNAESCGIYVGLVSPGERSNLSKTSTRVDLGVAPEVNGGAASIAAWWRDDFIHWLVREALRSSHSRPSAADVKDSVRLVELAVYAADLASQHDPIRRNSWNVVSRLWELGQQSLSFGTYVSLATGFPPSSDGSIDVDGKRAVLDALAEKLEDSNFRQGFAQIKERAEGDELAHLEAALAHLQSRCDVITALKRSIPYYYLTDSDEPWWRALTVDRWTKLLEEDRPRKGAIKLEITNSFGPHGRGFVPVVRDGMNVRVTLPEGALPADITLTRDGGGGAKGRRIWDLHLDGPVEVFDDELPFHKTPVRYVAVPATLAGEEVLKRGAIKGISLNAWIPGVLVQSRTAEKGTPARLPKTAQGGHIEASLLMNGTGRHYLDVFLRDGVLLTSLKATPSDERGRPDPSSAVNIVQVSANDFGLEVECPGDRYYEVNIQRPDGPSSETFRINLSADEVSSDDCGSQFELLLRQNAVRTGTQPRGVQVNAQVRSAHLQGWMLDESNIEQSYYPLVFASDYAACWRVRDWSSQSDTIASRGRFVNDPRPSPGEMAAPPEFIEARKRIAMRIRGDGEDAHALVEAAPLGEWLATDVEFAALIETYVQSYSTWLSQAPENASWCDVAMVTRFESDGVTLMQDPDAIIVSPLHPIRLAWHCIAQRALFYAQRKVPCPAAGILDPDTVPDFMPLPLRNATGAIRFAPFLSVQCSSEYWGILWNAARLDRLTDFATNAPLDREMGLIVGGMADGFSVSQVHRALYDVSEMLVAKPQLSVLISSAAGQSNSCNEGLASWLRTNLSAEDSGRVARQVALTEVFILDERRSEARPGDAEISNIAEDTGNAALWFTKVANTDRPDLGIIAQLETSNVGVEVSKLGSPLSIGGLTRSRIREQLSGANGELLIESRIAGGAPATGDVLSDLIGSTLAQLENLGGERIGYVFAPSVHAISRAIGRAEFVAISSSAVDPACFLGGWLNGAYLWDYDLPAYTSRSGESSGYYLLSRVKDLDLDTLRAVLGRLPSCKDLDDETLKKIVLEVARRGIPTVRGLSKGNSGASGDLGLFIATRFLQELSAPIDVARGLLPVWTQDSGTTAIHMVVPVDPFKAHVEDLAKSLRSQRLNRPDLVVVSLRISASNVSCKITPVEVKFRTGSSPMPVIERLAALGQAKSLTSLFESLRSVFLSDSTMTIWMLAFQNLLSSILAYGFRVYSQHIVHTGRSSEWSALHARTISSLLAGEMSIEFDGRGRLIVIDGSPFSAATDSDSDGFRETVQISAADAASIVLSAGECVLDAVRSRLGLWDLAPELRAFDSSTGVALHSTPPTTAPDSQEDDTRSNITVDHKAAASPRAEIGAITPNEAIPSNGLRNGEPSVREARANYDGMRGAAVHNATEEKPGKLVEDFVAEPSLERHQGVCIRVGEVIDSFVPTARSLALGSTAMNQLNVGVVGDLGTGKTQLLKSIIYQLSESTRVNRGLRPRVLIFDYKKDYTSDDFVAAVGARVVKPYQLPLNIFDLAATADAQNPRHDRFRFFNDVLAKIYAGIGPVQRDRLKRSVKAAYESAEASSSYPTIYDVHAAYEAMSGKPDSLSGVLGDIVDMGLFVADARDVVPLDEFLEGVVVISLNELGQDDLTKNMLVAIMLNIFYEHMLKIPKRPFLGEGKDIRVVDSILLVDEADNIMKYEFDVLRKILLQGREFGVGVILASQYLSHFKVAATDYREMLLSWIIHKVPNVKPQDLSALGISDSASLAHIADRIKSLGLHEAMLKSNDVAGEFIVGFPFYKRSDWFA
jgi:hypothetical protein